MVIDYACGNEDFRSEQRALCLREQDAILCITGSGDRALNLLHGVKFPVKMVCCDKNIAQNRLFRLKLTALLHVANNDEYLKFMGIVPADPTERTRIYLSSMEAHESSSMEAHESSSMAGATLKAALADGAAFSGRLERFSRATAAITRGIVGGRNLQSILRSTSVAEQKEAYSTWRDQHKAKARFLFSLFNAGTFLLQNIPGLSPPFGTVTIPKPAGEIYNRFAKGLARHLISESITGSLLICGQPVGNAIPPYLREDTLNELRTSARLCNFTSVTADVIEYLESSQVSTFDAFSMSDCLSYLPNSQVPRLFRAVLKRARNGARFLFRQFLTKHDVPQEYAKNFLRDPVLERELLDEDTSFLYTFCAGVIQKEGAGGEIKETCMTGDEEEK
jgi:S-adenosylmethionine-diacylglycerol 3-amino-3-carboxypropyl transferase